MVRGRSVEIFKNSGQSALEYILLVAIVSVISLGALRLLNQWGVMGKVLNPLATNYAMTYKYGDPRATGFDEGGPNAHYPKGTMAVSSTGSTRMFINPQ